MSITSDLAALLHRAVDVFTGDQAAVTQEDKTALHDVIDGLTAEATPPAPAAPEPAPEVAPVPEVAPAPAEAPAASEPPVPEVAPGG